MLNQKLVVSVGITARAMLKDHRNYKFFLVNQMERQHTLKSIRLFEKLADLSRRLEFCIYRGVRRFNVPMQDIIQSVVITVKDFEAALNPEVFLRQYREVVCVLYIVMTVQFSNQHRAKLCYVRLEDHPVRFLVQMFLGFSRQHFQKPTEHHVAVQPKADESFKAWMFFPAFAGILSLFYSQSV